MTHLGYEQMVNQPVLVQDPGFFDHSGGGPALHRGNPPGNLDDQEEESSGHHRLGNAESDVSVRRTSRAKHLHGAPPPDTTLNRRTIGTGRAMWSILAQASLPGLCGTFQVSLLEGRSRSPETGPLPIRAESTKLCSTAWASSRALARTSVLAAVAVRDDTPTTPRPTIATATTSSASDVPDRLIDATPCPGKRSPAPSHGQPSQSAASGWPPSRVRQGHSVRDWWHVLRSGAASPRPDRGRPSARCLHWRKSLGLEGEQPRAQSSPFHPGQRPSALQ